MKIFCRHGSRILVPFTNSSTFFFAIIFLLAIGCKKEKQEEDGSNTEIIINKNVLVVSDSPLELLLDTVSRNDIVFSKATPEIEAIKPGTILVSRMVKKAPDGFLRKVINVENKSGKKIVKTIDAKLTDAVFRGKIHIVKEFVDSNIIATETFDAEDNEGGKTQGYELGGSFKKTFNTVLFDKDGKSSTKGDRLNFKGKIEARFTTEIDLDIEDMKVKKFSIVTTFNNFNKLELSTEIGLPEIIQEKVLYTHYLTPITFSIGVVPVVLTNKLAFVAGIEGKIATKIECGVSNSYHSSLGVIYENKDWHTIKKQENKFSDNLVNVLGTVRAEPFLLLRYEMRPYELPNIRFNLNARASIVAEAFAKSREIDWTLKLGSKFYGLAQMNFLGNNLLDFENTFYEREFFISSGTIQACDGTLSMYCGPIQGGTDYELPISVNFPACGGTAPYKYKLDDGEWQNSSILQIKSWGSHIIWVKDSKGCLAKREFTIR